MSEGTRAEGGKALEFIRFIKGQLSAGVATGVHWMTVSVLIFQQVFYVQAVIIGSAAGAITDFAIKKWWVFGTDIRRSHHEVLRYAMVSGASAMLNGGVVYALVEWLGFHKAPSVGIASVLVGVLWNYPMHRLFVFSHVDAEKELDKAG